MKKFVLSIFFFFRLSSIIFYCKTIEPEKSLESDPLYYVAQQRSYKVTPRCFRMCFKHFLKISLFLLPYLSDYKPSNGSEILNFGELIQYNEKVTV